VSIPIDTGSLDEISNNYSHEYGAFMSSKDSEGRKGFKNRVVFF